MLPISLHRELVKLIVMTKSEIFSSIYIFVVNFIKIFLLSNLNIRIWTLLFVKDCQYNFIFIQCHLFGNKNCIKSTQTMLHDSKRDAVILLMKLFPMELARHEKMYLREMLHMFVLPIQYILRMASGTGRSKADVLYKFAY